MNMYRIPEIAEKYTHYDMITDHTELPDFPHYRTKLLYCFLNGGVDSGSGGFQLSELYALVTSLVQMGLDTHDMVDADGAKEQSRASRSKQLKVLAGDYFSGRFYSLLSQSGQVETIGLISNAICEVNRLKLNLYVRMKQLKMTAEEFLQTTVHIKMQLFLSLHRFMEGPFLRLWPEVLEGITKCEVITDELVRSDSGERFRGSWAYWYIMQSGTKEEGKQLQNVESDEGKLRMMLHKYKIRPMLYKMLETQLAQISQLVHQFEPDKMGKELLHIVQPFAGFLSKYKKV